MNIIADALNYIDDELIFCALNATADGKSVGKLRQASGGRAAVGRGAGAVAAIAVSVIASAFVCVIIILWAIIVFSGANAVDPNAPVGYYYSLGEQITDVNGNTICLENASLEDSVTIGGQICAAEDGGAFLLISGSASASEFGVSLADMTYSLPYGDSGKLNVRDDLFAYFVGDGGGVEGEIVLVFEVDAATLQMWRDELSTYVGGYVSFVLTFEDFMQGEGDSLVPSGYDFTLDFEELY